MKIYNTPNIKIILVCPPNETPKLYDKTEISFLRISILYGVTLKEIQRQLK